MKVGDRVRVTGAVSSWGVSLQGRFGKVEQIDTRGVVVRLSHPPDPRIELVCLQPDAVAPVSLESSFVCVRGQRGPRRKCRVCRHLTGTKLCDGKIKGPRGRVRTCSIPVCTSCAVHEDPDLDYCPDCDKARKAAATEAAKPPAQRELFR